MCHTWSSETFSLNLHEIFNTCIFSYQRQFEHLTVLISNQTSTPDLDQVPLKRTMTTQIYVLRLLPFFSEMASQKWITFFAFLSLLAFMVEIRSSSACLEEVSLRLENTITALDICENDTNSGKSPNCPVKAKRGRDEKRFHKVLHRKGPLVLESLAIHT